MPEDVPKEEVIPKTEEEEMILDTLNKVVLPDKIQVQAQEELATTGFVEDVPVISIINQDATKHESKPESVDEIPKPPKSEKRHVRFDDNVIIESSFIQDDDDDINEDIIEEQPVSNDETDETFEEITEIEGTVETANYQNQDTTDLDEENKIFENFEKEAKKPPDSENTFPEAFEPLDENLSKVHEVTFDSTAKLLEDITNELREVSGVSQEANQEIFPTVEKDEKNQEENEQKQFTEEINLKENLTEGNTKEQISLISSSQQEILFDKFEEITQEAEVLPLPKVEEEQLVLDGVEGVQSEAPVQQDKPNHENEENNTIPTINEMLFGKTPLEETEEEKAKKVPKFTQFLNNSSFKKGDNIHLDCLVQSSIGFEVAWYKDNSPIQKSTKNIGIYRELGVCSLEIVSARSKDQGIYRCIASNQYGKDETSCQLTFLEEKALKANFKEQLRDQEVAIGEEVFLDCTVESLSSSDQIDWYFNDHPIMTGDDIDIFQEAGICSLQIRKMQNNLQGVYTCIVRNNDGNVFDETRCKISAVTLLKISPNAKSYFNEYPQFVNELNNRVYIRENESLNLLCRLNDDCDPKPLIEWFIDGQNTDSLNINKITKKYVPKTGECRLIIDECSKANSGTYSCVAIVAGSSEIAALTSAKVKILAETENESESEPEVSDTEGAKGIAPFFLQFPQDQECEEGENIDIKAQIMGAPLPDLTWYYTKDLDGNEELTPVDDSLSRYDRETGILVLQIKNANKQEHSGYYLLRAENQAGYVTHVCRLTLKSRKYPELDKSIEHAPKFVISLPESIEIMDGQEANFVCVCSALPEPEIVWLRDFNNSNNFGPLNITNDVKISYDPVNGKCCLKITDVYPQDTGKYKCIAKNKYGIAETVSKLTVERKSS